MLRQIVVYYIAVKPKSLRCDCVLLPCNLLRRIFLNWEKRLQGERLSMKSNVWKKQGEDIASHVNCHGNAPFVTRLNSPWVLANIYRCASLVMDSPDINDGCQRLSVIVKTGYLASSVIMKQSFILARVKLPSARNSKQNDPPYMQKQT